MPVYNNTVIAGGGIGGPDVALMSTLLRALRSYSTVTSCQTPGGCHGSPVMVLKDLIDAHFSEAAAAAAVSPLSSHASPFTNFTSRVCIYHLSRFCVRLSVCLSRHSASAHRCSRFAAVGPMSRRYRLTAAWPALSSKCKQCRTQLT